MDTQFALSVPIRSLQLRDEVHRFLTEHYRLWSDLVPEPITDCFDGPFTDEDLSGIAPKCAVGFDFFPRTVGPELEYNLALARWAAIQTGRRKTKFRGPDFDFRNPVPFITLQGQEFPILVKDEWGTVAAKRLQPYVYDGLGLKTGDAVLRELAWHYLPHGAFARVGVLHFGKPGHVVTNALIQEGLAGARGILNGIRTQISRLDALWAQQKHVG